MSTDDSTISFPVDKFKAETLRLMAKDLGVIPGGKKDELLERLRASSGQYSLSTNETRRRPIMSHI